GPLCHTPVSVAYRPVIRTERAGAHTGWFVTAWVKFFPCAASASRLGVFVELFNPFAPTKSQRNWSERYRMIFGFRFTAPAAPSASLFAPAGNAAATPACAAAAAVPKRKFRRLTAKAHPSHFHAISYDLVSSCNTASLNGSSLVIHSPGKSKAPPLSSKLLKT